MEQVTLTVDGIPEIFSGETKAECMLKMYDRTLELRKEFEEQEYRQKYQEIPCKGIKGFLLYDPLKKKYFFQVHNEPGKHVNYEICAEDIAITLDDKDISLYNGITRNKIDWRTQ